MGPVVISDPSALWWSKELYAENTLLSPVVVPVPKSQNAQMMLPVAIVIPLPNFAVRSIAFASGISCDVQSSRNFTRAGIELRSMADGCPT